jgi:phage terminase large subunit
VERQRIEIPYAPRAWARKLHRSFNRWAALILHRRAGKTTAILNHHQRAAMDDTWEMARLRFLLPDASEDFLRPLLKRRVYWHVMPTLRQARLVAWDMLKEFSQPIPGRKANESEMSIKYPNGNRVQLIGADDPDSLRGPALSGLSLDEYSQIPANAFGEVLSKALGDHLGYCVFSGTIKGKDQLYQIYEGAKADPEWYTVWQDIDESLATESGPTITALRRAMEDDLKLVRQGAMTQAEYDQEWYLSTDAAIKGAYYLDAMATAKREGRLTRVPYDPMLPVDTDWDLGIDDLLVVWFSQSTRSGEVRLIDFYETAGKGIPEVAQELKGKPYAYGKHWGPHDIQVKELGTGKSRLAVAAAHGINFDVTPRLHGEAGFEVSEGIKAVRMLLPRCWFDAEKCKRGLEALRHYKSVFNKQLGQFTGVPVHDWASHGADAFRGLAVRHQIPQEKKRQAAMLPLPSSWMGS